MKKLLTALFFLIMNISNAQELLAPEEVKVKKTSDDTKEVYEDFEVEVLANYEGGIAAFRKEVEGNLIYSSKAKAKGTQGRVIMQFIVNKEGVIEDIKVIKDIGDGCGEAAIEAMKKIKKRWTPAKDIKGKVRKCRKIIPIDFKL